MAELLVLNREPARALEYYLRLPQEQQQHTQLFRLIVEHRLFGAVEHQVCP